VYAARVYTHRYIYTHFINIALIHVHKYIYTRFIYVYLGLSSPASRECSSFLHTQIYLYTIHKYSSFAYTQSYLYTIHVCIPGVEQAHIESASAAVRRRTAPALCDGVRDSNSIPH